MLFRIKLLGFCVSKRISSHRFFTFSVTIFPSYIRQPLSVLLYSIRQRNSDIIPCSRINPKKDSANEEKRIIKFTTISSSLQLYTACSTFGPTRQNDPFFIKILSPPIKKKQLPRSTYTILTNARRCKNGGQYPQLTTNATSSFGFGKK